MTESRKRTRDWLRCGEGFTELDKKATTTKNGQKKSAVKRKSCQPSFPSERNIFENLFGGINDSEKQCSQNIAWSSSDNEDESKTEQSEKKETVLPVVKRSRCTPSNVANSTQKDTSKEATIADYESDSEGCSSQISKQKEETESQVSIATVDSTSPPATQAGSGLKASEWVKSLQLKTPSKSQCEEKQEFDESAKKKQARGGLAEQLSRLQGRNKSSLRMWTHQQTKSSSQDSKSINLKVIRQETLYSLQVVRCVELIDDKTSQSGQGTSKSETATGNIRLVMFPASQSEQMNLKIGTEIKICPPWQQLELNNGEQIMLCTKYCQVIGSAETQVSKPVPSTENTVHSVTVKAKWGCPCVQGLCRTASLCPAYQFPAVAGLVQEGTCNTAAEGSKVIEKETKTPPLKKASSHLHTVSSSSITQSEFSSKCQKHTQQTTICDSLLKSIESSRGATGYLSENAVVSFTGYVHRHTVLKEQKGTKRHGMLVEDGSGTVCQIVLSEETLLRQPVDTSSLDGTSLQFTGLVVKDRLTRDRDECLFTMVDSVWSGHTAAVSQDSQCSSQSLAQDGGGLQRQGFCYILCDLDPGQVTISTSNNQILQGKPPANTFLIDLNSLHKPSRCSCIVRLMYVHKHLGKHGSYMLYVTDTSMTGKTRYVKILSPSDINTQGRAVVRLQDLLVTNHGDIKADSWSKMVTLDRAKITDNKTKKMVESLLALTIKVEPFTEALTIDDLCSIKGKICEVDEEAAYSWDACRFCDSDQTETAQGKTTCLVCRKSMEEPVTRMKMEVIVVADITNVRAKVDLMQSTIESLLPAEDGDEEGYELSSVLHKSIGPLHCRVSDISDKLFTLQQIQLS